MSDLIGKRVIVRSYYAGVMYGTLEHVDGQHAVLKNARNIWKWVAPNGSIALHEVAVSGVDPKNSQLTSFIETVEMLEACSIFSVTKEAEDSLDGAPVFDCLDIR